MERILYSNSRGCIKKTKLVCLLALIISVQGAIHGQNVTPNIRIDDDPACTMQMLRSSGLIKREGYILPGTITETIPMAISIRASPLMKANLFQRIFLLIPVVRLTRHISVPLTCPLGVYSHAPHAEKFFDENDGLVSLIL